MEKLWSFPWVFIQVLPILFTFGRFNITSLRYFDETNDFRPIYSFFLNFSEYEYYITGGLFLSSLSLSASSLWPNLLKSLPGFTDSSNCVIHASASSSKFIFHLHSGDHFKGSIEDRVSLDYYTWKRLEFNFGDLNGRAEACLTLDDAEV